MYYVNSLDNLTSFWLPNTHFIFGDQGIKDYKLEDTRLVYIQQRTMITLNAVHPNCYMVTKVLDMTPQGIIKLSLKQDDYDPSRDNVDLLLCDYFTDTGDITTTKPTGSDDPEKWSNIIYMEVDEDGELAVSENPLEPFELGKTYYFSATFSDPEVDAQWRIIFDDETYSEEDRFAIERLMVLRNIDTNTVSVKPSKSKKLPGLKFKLNVCDINGDYDSSIDVEVAE